MCIINWLHTELDLLSYLEMRFTRHMYLSTIVRIENYFDIDLEIKYCK